MHKLLNKNFFLLLQGLFLSEVLTVIFRIGSVIWLKERTGSPEIVGLFVMTLSLPFVFISPFGGAIADWFPRKRIIMSCDVLLIVLTSILFVVMFFSQDIDISISLLFIAAAAVGCVSAVVMPTVLASIPDLVPKGKLEAGNGLFMSSTQLSMLIGRLSAGALLVVLGAPLLIALKAIGHIFSLTAIRFITIPSATSRKAKNIRDVLRSFGSEMAEGFRYILQKKGMGTLFLVIALTDFFIAPCWVLLPFFIEEVLNEKTEWYGFLLAALAVGTILGSILPTRINIATALKSKVFIFTIFLASACLFSISFVGQVTYVLYALVCFGACQGLSNILALSTIQRSTPWRVQGRVLGLYGMLRTAFVSLSMGLSGIVAGWLGDNTTLFFAGCGLLGMLTLPVLVFSRHFHGLMGCEASAEKLAEK